MITQTLATRVESDSLGEVTLAGDCLHGINTARGRENFAISHRALRDEPAFVRALAHVKKAAALANCELGVLPPEIANAIVTACEEIVEGRHHEHFVIDMLEGSGGTSINMNANEVIANRALQISGGRFGDYRRIHPNDHVNLGQSTNDVVPTALKIAVYEKTKPLLQSLDGLATALAAKADEFSDVLRLGRTCLQSAQPMTLGQAFGGYAAAVKRSRDISAAVARGLLVVPLGGTAIGTGLGAAAGYREAALRYLAEVTGWPISGLTISSTACRTRMHLHGFRANCGAPAMSSGKSLRTWPSCPRAPPAASARCCCRPHRPAPRSCLARSTQSCP